MKTNAVPPYDTNNSETGCCPRFEPEPWENQFLHFERKPFVKAGTWSILYIPMNMASVFTRAFKAIEQAGANPDYPVILSKTISPWRSEHYFSATRDVPGMEMAYLSGDYLTEVFEGPFKNEPGWHQSLREKVAALGKRVGNIYSFYTTCPGCAKHYGKNYVVGVAELLNGAPA